MIPEQEWISLNKMECYPTKNDEAIRLFRR
jgi:hypothetical protein